MKGRTWFAGAVVGLALTGLSGWGAIANAQVFLLQESGRLEEGDSVLPSDNSLYDEYVFEGQQGQTITIDLQSDDFNTYLAVIDPQGQVIGENDDAEPGDQNSRLDLTLTEDGTYIVIANGYDSSSRGDYTLEVKAND